MLLLRVFHDDVKQEKLYVRVGHFMTILLKLLVLNINNTTNRKPLEKTTRRVIFRTKKNSYANLVRRKVSNEPTTKTTLFNHSK